MSIYSKLPTKKRASLKKIEAEISKNLRTGKKAAFEIGRRLYMAKKILPRGTFDMWVQLTWKGELRRATAHKYLSVYRTFEDDWPKAAETMSMQTLYMISSPSYPEVLRKIAITNPGLFDGCSLIKIKRASKAFIDGYMTRDQFIRHITTNIGERLERYQKVEDDITRLRIKLAGIERLPIPKNERKAFGQSINDLAKELVKLKAEKIQAQP